MLVKVIEIIVKILRNAEQRAAAWSTFLLEAGAQLFFQKRSESAVPSIQEQQTM